MNNLLFKHACKLTYLGILPFLACALAIYLHIFVIHAVVLFKAYGGIIAAFICGIHWALALQEERNSRCWPLIVSNISALTAWMAISITNIHVSLSVLAVNFLLLLSVDIVLFNIGWISGVWLKLRCVATICVVSLFATVIGITI